VIEPVDISVNDTVRGVNPISGAAVKFATGATGAGSTVIKFVFNSESLPNELVTVRLTEYVPFAEYT
jgi:hypothetical protein